MIYILVDDIVKAKFFLVFAQASNVTFITNKISCYIFFKLKCKSNLIFLRKMDGGTLYKNEIDIGKLEKTISVLNKRQSLESAISNYLDLYNSLSCAMNDLLSENDLLIVFNGNHPSALAAVDFFKKDKVKVLYAEISNLPGKMIFDARGVNAQSILYSKPELLNLFEPVSEEFHSNWIKEYIDYKENPIPQSKISVVTYIIIAFDDFISRILPKLIREDSLSFFQKVNMFANKFKSKKILAGGIKEKLSQGYIFFPTQVTSDTQLKINSSLDNIGAITHILKETNGNKVFVKIHPAESDIKTINYFLNLARDGEITLVNNNTIELIKNAEMVYTINSTVGLESLILGKKVRVLGKAIYSNFDSLMLKQYIHRYLIDFDYFGENQLDASHVQKLTKLSEL